MADSSQPQHASTACIRVYYSMKHIFFYRSPVITLALKRDELIKRKLCGTAWGLVVLLNKVRNSEYI